MVCAFSGLLQRFCGSLFICYDMQETSGNCYADALLLLLIAPALFALKVSITNPLENIIDGYGETI